jgi:hypothetical protein
MKKFIITSERIGGEIELYYEEEVVSAISFSKAQMTAVQKRAFLNEVPVLLADLEAFVLQRNITCIASSITITFDMFWDKYNFKVDKKRAQAIWDKLTNNQQIAAFYGIDKYKRYLKRTDWRNQMEAKSYLRNERWEDEWK